MEFHIPFRMTPTLLRLTHEIEVSCRYLYPLMSKKIKAKLMKDAKINTIQSFLSMEENELSTIQIKKILLGKPVKLSTYEMKEIKNVSCVYQHFKRWDPLSLKHFKEAHGLLMDSFDERHGLWRKYQVHVFQGKKITYIPPYPEDIAYLMRKLFQDIKKNKGISWLIKSCVFHYGIQYIHPFTDGNGRIGRIWQHFLLLQENPIFHYVLVSVLIKKNPLGYYRSLDKSDSEKNGAIFVEFCLKKMIIELKKLAKIMDVPLKAHI